MPNVLQIRNPRSHIDAIHQNIYQHVAKEKSVDPQFPSYVVDEYVLSVKEQIESVCAKHNATPADLGTPTFRMYLWLRFLENYDNCSMHINAVNEFSKILAHQQPTVNLHRLHFKIDFSGYLYQRKNGKNGNQLQINEAFISAPVNVKEMIISAAYAKRRGKRIERIREYTGSSFYIDMNKQISGDPVANKRTCVGQKYDLSVLYHSLNQAYFGSKLKPLRLIWSSSRAKRRLGYYHPDIHTIAINQKLDDKNIPRLLIDYVLYHEMLHQYFGIEHRNGRRYAHTSAFHKAEAKFKNRDEAENLIKLLHN